MSEQNSTKCMILVSTNSSAVAEMGDHDHNRHGPKRGKGGCCAPFAELGPRLTQCVLGQGLLLYQVASSSIQPFGHNRHGPKTEGAVPLLGGSRVPIEHKVAWAEAYLHTTWHLNASSHLAAIEKVGKLGGSAPFLGRGAGSLSNTKSPGLRPTSMPSTSFKHPAVWPQ